MAAGGARTRRSCKRSGSKRREQGEGSRGEERRNSHADMNTRLPSARAQTRLLGHARRAAAGLGPLGGVEAAGGVVVDGVQVRPRLSGVRHDHRAHHLLRHPNHPRWSSCTDSKSNTKSAVSSIAFRARTLTARDARIHQPVASAQPSAFRLGWRGTLHPGLTAPPPFPPPPLHSHADRRSL